MSWRIKHWKDADKSEGLVIEFDGNTEGLVTSLKREEEYE